MTTVTCPIGQSPVPTHHVYLGSPHRRQSQSCRRWGSGPQGQAVVAAWGPPWTLALYQPRHRPSLDGRGEVSRGCPRQAGPGPGTLRAGQNRGERGPQGFQQVSWVFIAAVFQKALWACGLSWLLAQHYGHPSGTHARARATHFLASRLPAQ